MTDLLGKAVSACMGEHQSVGSPALLMLLANVSREGKTETIPNRGLEREKEGGEKQNF